MAAPPRFEPVTVADAVSRYLRGVDRAVAGHSMSPTTAGNYRRDLAEFVALAGGDRVLDTLSGADVDDIVLTYGSRPDGRYRPSTAGPVKTRGRGAQARFRQSVSRLFAEAALEGWVQASPMPRTKVRPRAAGMVGAARKALPQAAAEALLLVPDQWAQCRSNPRADQRLGLRDEFLLRLLIEAGPRVSEVCRADRADLQPRDDGTTWLRVLGKGRKERWLPLSSGTLAAYRRYESEERPPPRDEDPPERQEDAERALLLTWRARRMQPRDVQLLVERASRRLPAQVRRQVTPHGLRHTAATLLLASGAADIKTVQHLLGHESIATTGVYLDTIDSEMAQAVAAHPVTGRTPGR
jgi:site-specific recombinase XerD